MNSVHSVRSVCLVLVLALTGCADRQIEMEDQPEVEPTCMILPARGHWNDGTSYTINNEWGTVGSVCLCLTEDERASESVREELNDLAYEECNRISKLEWDFDWTECQELYEAKTWWNGVFIARGDTAWMNHTGLTCEEAEPTSCSVLEREGATPLALLVSLGLSGLWLRSTRRSKLESEG
jgi:hypothetical protein